MSRNKALEEILIKARNEVPRLSEGQVFETMTSIYPNEKISPNLKNVIEGEVRLTLPKASCSKSKRQFRKKGGLLGNLFKEGIKGDFLVIEKIVDEDTFYCKNISILEDVSDKYYSDKQMKYIRFTRDDIVQNNIKRVYRGFKPHMNNNKKIFGGK